MSPDAYVEMAALQNTHWWFVARRRILQKTISALDLPDNAKILEIGSGTGSNLSLLSVYGTVLGLEMSQDAIDMARQAGNTSANISMQLGKCPDDLNQIITKFDLICLFDVLEHIDEDATTLTRLKALLKPNGKIIISVPAFQWLWSGHDQFLHHKRRYTKQTLSSCLEEAQLAARYISYFNCLLFPLAVLGRLFDRLMQKKNSSGSTVPSPFINRFLMRIFASERHLLVRYSFPFGLSLLAIAQSRDE
jgi:SAM-dependent methyltransferase